MRKTTFNLTKLLACGVAIPVIANQGCTSVGKVEKEDPLNVILILADDMGLGDISCFNDGRNRTPNLNKLIEGSIWFNKAYSAAPVSAPSRAALLTGQYPHRTGCVTLSMIDFPELARIDTSILTIADVFKDNGYVTGLVGKWHCGVGKEYSPLSRGFEEFEGFRGFNIKSYFDYTLNIQDTLLEVNDKYLTDDLTERAIGFIQKHKDEPFFLHLAYYAPHRPLGAPQEVVEFYLDKGYNEKTATVYAMIEIMDRGIGQLLNELDNLGIRGKTLILFSSDNGPDPITGDRFNHNMSGTKYTVNEGGIHVPFIVNWEGTLTPEKKDEIVHSLDVFPTLIDICGLKVPGSLKLDGHSIAGTLLNHEIDTIQREYYWQWNRGVPLYTHNAAMRKGKWKLVRPYVTRSIPEGESNLKPVLYDLDKDPFEQEDVSAKYQKTYDIMRVSLEEWCRKVEFSRLENKSR